MRLADHNRKKDFWERALVLISKTNSLTQTHALFLEWLCLQKAREAGRYGDENGNSGSKPHTPAPMEADCHEIYDTGKTLLATLGYPLFTGVRETTSNDGDLVYRLTSSGADGRGVYTAEGFTVLAGSRGRRESVPSLVNTPNGRFREKLIDRGVMQVEGDQVVFPNDHLFKTPSGAAISLAGRSANGWREWKLDDGRTLGDVERGDSDA